MRAREELIARLAEKRRAALGDMSDRAFGELKLAVREEPEAFIDTPANQAFFMVCKAIERFEKDCEDGEALEDVEYYRARRKRRARIAADCEQALAADPACVDARLIKTLVENDNPEVLLGILLAMEEPVSAEGDAWDDVLLRPQLRVRAAAVRMCMETARYRMAVDKAQEMIALAPGDELGCRHSAALAYARLEDERGFEDLDERFGHTSSAWSLLGRTILNYKLDRMGAARRSLAGYSALVEGGAYALLRPVLVDTYLPDRPQVAPLCFQEAMFAVHEADPIVVDVPDFAAWAESQRSISSAALAYADIHDLDW